jgi:flagellar FliJ protein
MDRIKILGTLLEREQQRRDDAARECQALERQARAAQGQVQSLQDYRVEYQQRWSGQFQQSAPIEILRCYHGFVGRLDQAINAQQGVAARPRPAGRPGASACASAS